MSRRAESIGRPSWPPEFPGMETPSFLRTARGDFPPDSILEAERAAVRFNDDGADTVELGEELAGDAPSRTKARRSWVLPDKDLDELIGASEAAAALIRSSQSPTSPKDCDCVVHQVVGRLERAVAAMKRRSGART